MQTEKSTSPKQVGETMINISSKGKCSGCTACMVSCPRDAISMVADDRGFKYPVVNSEKCINCKICDKVCPFNKASGEATPKEIYAVKHRNKEVLYKSTSGGFFTAVSDYIFECKGVIYGAAFDKNGGSSYQSNYTGTERYDEGIEIRSE